MKITAAQQIKFETLVTQIAFRRFRGDRKAAIRFLVLDQGITADKF